MRVLGMRFSGVLIFYSMVHMYRSGGLSTDLCPAIILSVLPTLVKLFTDTSNTFNSTVQERSIRIFSQLVSDDQELQKAALDGDAILQLANILTSGPKILVEEIKNEMEVDYTPKLPLWDQTEESILLAIASVTSLREENRRQALDSKILPRITAALSSPSTFVRAAACQCTRSLSRSVKNLRTSLVDSGVAIPLLKLLRDSDLSVQTAASATLCNIVLDFSPLKKIFIEHGGIESLVDMVVSSSDTTLRLNSLWALKNVLFQADSETKMRVISLLGFDVLKG